jgi:hypothetical protein
MANPEPARPQHCDKPMTADYAIAGRQNWCCANQCGHRSWTGEAAVLRHVPSTTLIARPCDLCHLALSRLAHKDTHYHRHCYATLKRRAQKIRQRHIALEAAK